MNQRQNLFTLLLTGSLVTAASVHAEPATSSAGAVDKQGVIRIPELVVPASSYMSAEAKKTLIDTPNKPVDDAWGDEHAPIAKLRALDEADVKEIVAKTKQRYPVTIEDRTIAGVKTRVIIPKSGIAARNKQRVLINLHGGGFFTGAGGQALLESIPVASMGGYKVITVDYRQGPEYVYPAATEDVVAVYQSLLKEYKPADIGVFGCSAGGTLTAMTVAWLQKQKIPVPGAIGIFSSGAYAGFLASPDTLGAWGGDSRYTAPALNGEPLLPLDQKEFPMPAVASVYLRGVNLQDPLVSPGLHPDVLAGFPATLVIAGTRGFDMSVAVQTHRELTKAGVDADLHVWDGVGHCFFSDAALPESREAFAVMTKFFDQRLGK